MLGQISSHPQKLLDSKMEKSRFGAGFQSFQSAVC